MLPTRKRMAVRSTAGRDMPEETILVSEERALALVCRLHGRGPTNHREGQSGHRHQSGHDWQSRCYPTLLFTALRLRHFMELESTRILQWLLTNRRRNLTQRDDACGRQLVRCGGY